MLRTPFILVIATVLGLIALGNVPYQTERLWIDPITGSTKTQTCWLFVCQNPVIKRTALEDWIVAHEGAYQPAWKRLSTLSRNGLGQVCRACSMAPAIHQLCSSGLLADYVRDSPDPEIREFVRVMRQAPSPEQERAVEAVCHVTMKTSLKTETR